MDNITYKNSNTIFPGMNKLIENHIILSDGLQELKDICNLRLVSKNASKVALQAVNNYFKNKFFKEFLLNKTYPWNSCRAAFLSDPHKIVHYSEDIFDHDMGLNRLIQTVASCFPDHYWMILWGLHAGRGDDLLKLLVENKKEYTSEILFERFKKGLKTEKEGMQQKIKQLEKEVSKEKGSLIKISDTNYEQYTIKNQELLEQHTKILGEIKLEIEKDCEKFIDDKTAYAFNVGRCLRSFKVLESYSSLIRNFGYLMSGMQSESLYDVDSRLSDCCPTSDLLKIVEKVKENSENKKEYLKIELKKVFSCCEELYGISQGSSKQFIDILTENHQGFTENNLFCDFQRNINLANKIIASIEKTETEIKDPNLFYETYVSLTQKIQDIVQLVHCFGCVEQLNLIKKMNDSIKGHAARLSWEGILEENRLLPNNLTTFLKNYSNYARTQIDESLGVSSESLREEFLKKIYLQYRNLLLAVENKPCLQEDWSQQSIENAANWFSGTWNWGVYPVFSSEATLSLFKEKIEELIRLTPCPYSKFEPI